MGKNTVRRYWREFELMAKLYPEKLNDERFRLPHHVRRRSQSESGQLLEATLPRLVDEYRGGAVVWRRLYQDYCAGVPRPLSLSRFSKLCVSWFRQHEVCRYAHRRVRDISEADKKLLTDWQNGDDIHYWKRAMVIFGSWQGQAVTKLAHRLEMDVKTVLHFIDTFNEKAAEGLIMAQRKQNTTIAARVSSKQANLIKLIHETPRLHGLNLACWTYAALSSVYKEVYGSKISETHAAKLLSRAGFDYKKSRILMTSPDKKFKEKVENIKRILGKLAADEKFFSVDEFGPFAVRKRGGRAITRQDAPELISYAQKSKGMILMTASLELSTNQVTHFYSPKIVSAEIIKLIERLVEQSAGQRKIYFCWDAAGWHRSKLVKNKIAQLNRAAYRQLNNTPEIEVAPLPDGAQFLNVIESVFVGLLRAVLHNSDYPSVETCQAAIDGYFLERNLHFKENPKKAGNKIWGDEVAPAVFDETNHTKTTKRLAARPARKKNIHVGLRPQTGTVRPPDPGFSLPVFKPGRKATDADLLLRNALPGLFENYKGCHIYSRQLFKDYLAIATVPMSFQQFKWIGDTWRQKHGICRYAHLRVREIVVEDLKTLNGWRKGGSVDYWRRAVVILGSYEGRTVHDMARQFGTRPSQILRFFKKFREQGIEGLRTAPYTRNPAIADNSRRQQDNLIRLLHDPPENHGIHRSAWRYGDLAEAYRKQHNENMLEGQARILLIGAGYACQSSRSALISHDPDYREKVEHIKTILSQLAPDEKFFSIDEYGQFSVRLTAGRKITDQAGKVLTDASPKSKGFLLVTAALELSTNQVTHFYSLKKNTIEMIRLIKLLMQQYKDQQTLYLSWDAASWHASNLLKARLAEWNSTAYRKKNCTPALALAPLPATAQYLNVIESVFSGLARAVIHNSDYPSVQVCKLAIDRHFRERNEFYLAHPKKAGNAIWGRERVKPVFSDTNACK